VEAMTKEPKTGTEAKNTGCLKSFVGVGLGLILGALAGIPVGLAAGVVIAMILGVL
jgi:hypothetical protein